MKCQTESFPFLLHVFVFAQKELGVAVGAERRPIAADNAVAGDDGLEDAAIVMSAMTVGRGKGYMAAFALVADEIFVVGRNEKVVPTTEAACAAVVSDVELATFPFDKVEIVASQLDATPALADVQP